MGGNYSPLPFEVLSLCLYVCVCVRAVSQACIRGVVSNRDIAYAPSEATKHPRPRNVGDWITRLKRRAHVLQVMYACQSVSRRHEYLQFISAGFRGKFVARAELAQLAEGEKRDEVSRRSIAKERKKKRNEKGEKERKKERKKDTRKLIGGNE